MRRGLALLWLSGCALGPGEPMGTIEPTITAEYSQAEGFQKLESEYEVRVDRFELTVPEFLLIAEESAATPAEEDGHGHEHGHGEPEEAHAEEAEPGFALHAGVLNLLAGTPLVPECEPECHVAATHFVELHAPVTAVAIEGVVRDSRTPPRIPERRFTFLWPLTGADPIPSGDGVSGGLGVSLEWEHELDLEITRDQAPQIRLGISIRPDAAIFEGVEWENAATTSDEVIALESAANQLLQVPLLQELSHAPVSVDVERSSP